MRAIVAALLPLVAAACATSPEQPQPAQAQAQTQQRCTREYPTGSNIPVTRCRTEEEMQREKGGVDAARDALRGSTPNRTQSGAGT